MSFRILILDNDRDYARTIGARCQALGMSVSIAAGAAEAIVQTNLQVPDVFCLDLAKSQLDGMAFCEYLAWNQETTNTPVVIMSRADEMESIRRCCPLNVIFLEKSIECWDKLRNELQSLMNSDGRFLWGSRAGAIDCRMG